MKERTEERTGKITKGDSVSVWTARPIALSLSLDFM